MVIQESDPICLDSKMVELDILKQQKYWKENIEQLIVTQRTKRISQPEISKT